jgi:predicted nucleic acid-binding protein
LANIFWDTNLFIYLLEDSPTFAQTVEDLRRRMLRRNDRLFTSAMSVGEVLTKPFSTGNTALADRYRAYFATPNVTVSAFDFGAAEAYAHIRQDRSIKAADAIQLACAVSAEADLFITNDDRLSQKNVPGVGFFITSLSRAPL